MVLTGETELLEEKPVTVPLRPTQELTLTNHIHNIFETISSHLTESSPSAFYRSTG